MPLLPTLVLAATVAVASPIHAGPDTADGHSASVTAFIHVTVLPMDADRVLTDHTVVVRGDRIVAVGPAEDIEVPSDAAVIDGTGRYLLPGLAEMHGHIPPPGQDPQDIENTLFLYLANGITTVRGMLGYPGQLDLRERANAGEIASPSLYLAGPSFNGNTVSSPEQAARRVRNQVDEGWDLLKIHPGLSRDEYDGMAHAAHELGIRFGGHVPAEVGLEHALAMGQETFDHLDGYVEYLFSVDPEGVDPVALASIVGRTIEAGAWVVPTMVLWETLYVIPDLDDLLAFPELKYVPAVTVASWRNAFESRLNDPQFDPAQAARVIGARMAVLEALNRAGARILMGTDAPQQFSVPGFSLHREIARMQDAGMTAWDVLYSGTARVGEYFGDTDTFGLVQEGHRADLLLASGNPLDDVSALSDLDGVMVRGRWYPADEIAGRLAEIAARYAE